MTFRGLRISARCTCVTAILSFIMFAVLSSNWGWYGYLKYSFLPCLIPILAAGVVFALFLIWSIIQSIQEIRAGRGANGFPIDETVLAAVSVCIGVVWYLILQ